MRVSSLIASAHGRCFFWVWIAYFNNNFYCITSFTNGDANGFSELTPGILLTSINIVREKERIIFKIRTRPETEWASGATHEVIPQSRDCVALILCSVLVSFLSRGPQTTGLEPTSSMMISFCK